MYGMDNVWQQALADEIRAELARQNRSARSAYMELGISSTAWQGYFKRLDRDVPSRVLIAVAGLLGMRLSRLLERVEAREVELRAPAGRGVDVDKILRDSPELAAVRAEGQRLMGERTTGE